MVNFVMLCARRRVRIVLGGEMEEGEGGWHEAWNGMPVVLCSLQLQICNVYP